MCGRTSFNVSLLLYCTQRNSVCALASLRRSPLSCSIIRTLEINFYASQLGGRKKLGWSSSLFYYTVLLRQRGEIIVIIAASAIYAE